MEPCRHHDAASLGSVSPVVLIGEQPWKKQKHIKSHDFRNYGNFPLAWRFIRSGAYAFTVLFDHFFFISWVSFVFSICFLDLDCLALEFMGVSESVGHFSDISTSFILFYFLLLFFFFNETAVSTWLTVGSSKLEPPRVMWDSSVKVNCWEEKRVGG